MLEIPLYVPYPSHFLAAAEAEDRAAVDWLDGHFGGAARYRPAISGSGPAMDSVRRR